MASWFTINLGDAMLASARMEDIERQFTRAFEQLGRPSEMALFSRHESEGRLHCELRCYLSPACHEIASALQARPCRQPSPTGLSLCVGAEVAVSQLFQTV